ncbi:MAG: ISAzo13 family transposase, partial [Thermosynechococcaceae cyanobacterium]
IKATFKDAARKLSGPKKRAFTAQVALDYFAGSARQTETAMGWDRVSIQRGLETLATGIPYGDNSHARGRKKCEVLLPNLAEDIHALVDGQGQADPKFQTSFQYLRVSAQSVRDALIVEQGYSDEALPSRQAIGLFLNRLGYRLRKPSRQSPSRKFQKLMPFSSR